jgi:hypothetical protein
MFLPSATTNRTKTIVTAGSKTSSLTSGWKIADNADKSTANQTTLTVSFCAGEADTVVPEVEKIIN